MRGEIFATMEDLHRRVDYEIGQIAQWEFRHALHESWDKRLQACIDAQGSYFEK